MTETPQVVKCCKPGWELSKEQDFQTSLSCVRSKGVKVGYFNNILLPPPSPSPSCNPCHRSELIFLFELGFLVFDGDGEELAFEATSCDGEIDFCHD